MARLETNGGVGGGVDTQSNSQKEVFETTSFLQGANAAYLEHMLTAFEADPATVGADWRAFFAGTRRRAASGRKWSDASLLGSRGLAAGRQERMGERARRGLGRAEGRPRSA